MIERGLLRRSASEVASFLRRRDGLHKKAIGAYLAEPGEFSGEVRTAFMKLFDFSDLTSLVALRSLLHTFLLQGEQQQIFRVLECFANEYHRQNPELGLQPDACLTLVYALVMLNNELHSPRVRKRMTPDEFLAMVTRTGNTLPPRDELLQLYHQLRAEQLPVATDDVSDDLRRALSQPEHHGWLSKQGGRVKTWKDRWFVLKHNCLHYFENPTDSVAKGIVVLQNVTLRTVSELEKANCFELQQLPDGRSPAAAQTPYLKSWKQSRRPLGGEDMVLGRHTEFRVSAPCQQEMAEWMRAIRRSIVLGPLTADGQPDRARTPPP